MSLLFGGSSYTDLIKDNNCNLWTTTPIIFPHIIQLQSVNEWDIVVTKIMYFILDAFYKQEKYVTVEIPEKFKDDIKQYLENSGYICDINNSENEKYVSLIVKGW